MNRKLLDVASDEAGNYIIDEPVVGKRPLIFDLNLPKEDIVTLAKALIFGSFIVGGFFGILISIIIAR
jgi:hypothetical protein